MKKPALATLAALAALATFATPLKWVCEWPEARAQSFTLYHGETATFEPSFRVNGSVATNVAVEACYVQTNGMGEAWWRLENATFHPSNDVGAASYRFFVRARAGGDVVVYRANGILRMQDSPGFEPAALPFPRRVLDFAAVEIANAPWPDEIAAATNAVPGTVSNIVTKSYVESLGISGGGGSADDFIANVSGDARLPAVDVDNFWYIRNETAGSSVRAYGLWKDWIEDVARSSAAGNYSAVSNAAMKAAQPSAVTNIVEALAYKKVSGAAAGNLPAFGTYGNIVDSGKKPADFASAAAVSTAATSATNYTDSVALQSASRIDTLWTYVYGESVWIAVTNYLRTVEGVLPSFQLWEVREGVTNCVYSSREEILGVTTNVMHECKTNLEAEVAAAVAAMPSKAWSRYQSATGADNPQPLDVTVVSTPVVQLTDGREWTKYANVRGDVYVLETKGTVSISPDTNNFFRVADLEGNVHFEVRKTDSYVLDAVPSATGFDEDGDFLASFWSDVEPVLYASYDLRTNFVAAAEMPSLAVSWANNHDGTWTATITQAEDSPQLFCYAKRLQTGYTAIVNSAPSRFDGGIVIGGVRYTVGTAVIDGKRVLTLETAP